MTIFTLTHCGDIATQQDPLDGYENAKKAVPIYERESITRYKFGATHKISTSEELNFIQGQEKRIDFKVQILTSFADEANYKLKINPYFKNLGAQFKKKNNNTWTLTWKPSLNLLGNSEANKRLDLEVELEILNSSSDRIKELFAATYKKSPFQIVVSKDISIPQFTKAVRLSKSQRLSLGQKTKVYFTVSAGNILNADEIQILLNPEDQKPTRDLLQASGKNGVLEDIKVLKSEVDKDGRLQIHYSLDFDSQVFWNHMLEDIQADNIIKRNYLRGDFSHAEAQLVIIAKNKANNRSERKEVFIIIDLNLEPAQVELISEKNEFEIESVNESAEAFIIKSKNSMGDLSIDKVSLDKKEFDFNDNDKKYSLENENHNLSIECKTLKRQKILELCEIGNCALNCQLRVKSNCTEKDHISNIKIKLINVLSDKKISTTLTRQIKIKKSEVICEGVQS